MNREEIQAEIESKLESYKTKLDEYKVKAAEASDSVNQEMTDAIGDLEAKLEAGKQRAQELASSSDEKFEEMRSQMEERFDDMKSQMESSWSSISDKLKGMFNKD